MSEFDVAREEHRTAVAAMLEREADLVDASMDAIATQILTFKYRLLPTRGQHARLRAALDHTRDLYNAALEERIDAYRKAGLSISWKDQCRSLTELRADSEWAQLPCALQRWPLKQVDLAFKAFFRRVKSGEAPGFPRFRSATRFKTFGFTDRGGWKVVGSRLRMKGIGAIRLNLHRPLPSDPICCKVKREGRNWYALLTVEVACASAHDGPAVGLDAGVAHLATLSTGEHFENARAADRVRRRVRVAQRALARCKRGSRRRQKVRDRLARMKQREANTRATRLHQISADLMRRFSVIVVEDLALRNMTRSPKGTSEAPGKNVRQKAGLNRALHDAALGRLIQLIDYKASKAGGQMIKVDPRHTSQTCSTCGHIDALSRRNQSEFCCVACGFTLNADVNAARNIARRAGVAVGEGLNVAGCGERAPRKLCAEICA